MDSNFIKKEVDFFIEHYTPESGKTWIFFLMLIVAFVVFAIIYENKKQKNKKIGKKDIIIVASIFLFGCFYSFYSLNLAPNVIVAKNLVEKNFCVVNTIVEDKRFETVERTNQHEQMKLKGIQGYHKFFSFAGEFESYKIGDKAVVIIGQPCSKIDTFQSDYIVKIQHGEYTENEYKKVYIRD